MSVRRRSPLGRRLTRLRDRGDVRRLSAPLGGRDWVADRDGRLIDLSVARRVAAVEALGTLDDRAAEEAVVAALGDEDARVARAAVEALGPAPGEAAATALARAAAGWRDPRFEAPHDAAVDRLAGLADPGHAVTYARALLDQPRDGALTPPEQDALRRLFANIRGPAADEFARDLVGRLGAVDERERTPLRQALVAVGQAATVPLVEALDAAELRASAAAMLGEIRDSRAVPALLKILASADAGGRAASARALGEIRDTRALEALLRATTDTDARVRDAALDAVDKMRSVATILVAAMLLNDRADAPLPLTDATAPPLPAELRDRAPSLLRRLLERQ